MADKDRRTQSKNREVETGESFGELHQFARSQMLRLESEGTRRWNVAIVGVLVALLLIVIVWFAIKSENTQIAAKGEENFTGSMEEQPGKIEVEDVGTEMTGGLLDAPLEEDGSVPVLSGELQVQNYLFIPSVFSGLPVCQGADQVKFELLAGPKLDPLEGTVVRTNKEPQAQAYWTIRNTGTCKWEKISLYSIINGSTLHPRIIRKGSNLEPVAFDHSSYPGDLLEVQATFQGDEAKKISAEWILVVNGYPMYSQPHLGLNINKWVVVQKPAKENQSQPGSQTDVNSATKNDTTSPSGQQTPPTRPAPGTEPTQPPPTRPSSDPPERP